METALGELEKQVAAIAGSAAAAQEATRMFVPKDGSVALDRPATAKAVFEASTLEWRMEFAKAEGLGNRRVQSWPNNALIDACTALEVEPVWLEATSEPGEQDEHEKMLLTAIRALTGTKAPVDADAVAALVEERLKAVRADVAELRRTVAESMKPLRIEVQLPNGEVKAVPGIAHAAVPAIIRRIKACAASPANILLVGPAGLGKTTMGHQIAEACGLEYRGEIAVSGGATESALLGRMTPNLTTGEQHYRPSIVTTAFEHGGLVLIDEVDGGDSNVLLALNSLLANGQATLPDGRRVARHAQCVVLACANTFGNGADRQYVGRNQLDAAFLDRFAGGRTFALGYDHTLELALAARLIPKVTAQTEWVKRFYGIRRRLAEAKVRRIWGTRALLGISEMIAAGYAADEAFAAATEGWTPADLTTAGERR